MCWSTSEVASPSPVVVEPIRRELSAERAAGVVNHGQGLGKIRTEQIGGHACSCRGMSGEASQEEVGISHSSPSMSAPTSTGAGTGVGRSSSRIVISGAAGYSGSSRPSPDGPTGATPDDGPGRPCRPRSARGSDASCPLVAVARPGWGFPAPSCGRPRPRGFREFVCCRSRAIPHDLRPWVADDSPPLWSSLARVSWRRWWS